MGMKCNDIENLLQNLYGNKDGWVDYESHGWHIIGMNYDRKLELLEMLLKEVKENNISSVVSYLYKDEIVKDIYSDLIQNISHKIQLEINKTKNNLDKENCVNQVYIDEDEIIVSYGHVCRIWDREGKSYRKEMNKCELNKKENITHMFKNLDIKKLNADTMSEIFNKCKENILFI